SSARRVAGRRLPVRRRRPPRPPAGFARARGGLTPIDARKTLEVGSWLRLCLLAGVWGCSFLFIKVALEGLSPPQVVLGRMLSGAVVLLAVIAVRRQRFPTALKAWGHLAVFTVIANIVPFLLFAWGEQRI